MFKLSRFLKDYKKQLFLGPFFKLCEAILELMLPFLMKKLIDNGISTGDTAYILRMGALMLLTTVLGLLCALICQYYASIASQGSGTALRNALFRKIQSFSGKEMDRFGSASLLNRLTNDTVQLQYAVAMLIRLVIRAPFLCIGGLVMAMIINLKLSLIILAVIPIFIIVLALIMKSCIPLFKLMQKEIGPPCSPAEGKPFGRKSRALLCPQFPGTPKIFGRFGRMAEDRSDNGQNLRPYESSYKPDSQYSHAGRFGAGSKRDFRGRHEQGRHSGIYKLSYHHTAGFNSSG